MPKFVDRKEEKTEDEYEEEYEDESCDEDPVGDGGEVKAEARAENPVAVPAVGGEKESGLQTQSSDSGIFSRMIHFIHVEHRWV
jgi:hypothetical protein